MFDVESTYLDRERYRAGAVSAHHSQTCPQPHPNSPSTKQAPDTALSAQDRLQRPPKSYSTHHSSPETPKAAGFVSQCTNSTCLEFHSDISGNGCVTLKVVGAPYKANRHCSAHNLPWQASSSQEPFPKHHRCGLGGGSVRSMRT